MRILKLKIAKAHESKNAKIQAHLPQGEAFFQNLCEIKRQTVSPSSSKGSGKKRSRGNNVMKNYAKAMVKFSLSSLADPYLEKMRTKYLIVPGSFKRTLLGYKPKVNCINNLRGILLVINNDTQEIKTFKLVFQEMCIIFMKFFCVNWIYNGRMSEKSKYLEYRGKILRRVQNPEHFTYLESFVKKSPKNKKC